jgi:hypothetical protein
VQLEADVWLAPWTGDPGRTLVRQTAKRFASITGAKQALVKARHFRPFPHARIEEYDQ